MSVYTVALLCRLFMVVGSGEGACPLPSALCYTLLITKLLVLHYRCNIPHSMRPLNTHLRMIKCLYICANSGHTVFNYNAKLPMH